MKKNLWNLYETETLSQIGTITKLISEQMSLANIPTFENLGLASAQLFENSALAQLQATSKLIAENSTIGLTSELIAKQSSLFGYSNSIGQIGAMAKLIAENSTIGLTSELIAKQISLIKNNTILDKDIENINDTDEKIISQIAEVILHFFPELNTIKNTLSKKQYFKMSIYLIIYLSQFYLSVLGTLSLFEDKNLNSYIINRNNVLVKSEPSTENSESIIELNKNYYVKKIDSYKNWIKVEFENENSELLEGWIRNDMLRKIEN